jgi:hypothetical protein
LIIRTYDSQSDIEQFVRTKVTETIKMKRLLSGEVSEELKNRIIKTHVDSAEGM